MKVGILNTDTLKTEFDTKYGQYPAMFSKVLLHAEPKIEIYSYEVQTGEYPDELNECDAYLITGSKVSAYDDLPWIVELKNFIRILHQHQKKLVGICFGHQLIAEALGGKVERAKEGWNVGIHAATLKKIQFYLEVLSKNLILFITTKIRLQRFLKKVNYSQVLGLVLLLC